MELLFRLPLAKNSSIAQTLLAVPADTLDPFDHARNMVLRLLIGLCLFSLMLGYMAGRLMDFATAEVPATILQSDTRGSVATVELKGIENGQLIAIAHGDIRLFLGKEQVMVGSGGSIQVPAGPLLHNVILVSVPEGMRFVASKRGTKYYSVDSAGGEGITPENRLYFATSEEAEKAGYKH